ncbi:hypothetical protein GPECTOR_45g159 [Gonium pectorale]|uniref:Uncharacterized protein n=1 Tax=Gonium pectorale TaxID=33097 RepID=A0A150G8V4_GONPE|nr:hypothetical protein GPECTOR_45g159 [Gonium pectorale]|eukprot:KXZ46289.1 hypothetical protein GPECTOR_45g159 [Gonium pectorale]
MADVLGSLGLTQDIPDDLGQLDDFVLLSNIARVDTWKEAGKSYRLPEDDVDMSIPILCCTLNINRFRYLLKCYWRVRLAKVERFATLLLDNRELQRK